MAWTDEYDMYNAWTQPLPIKVEQPSAVFSLSSIPPPMKIPTGPEPVLPGLVSHLRSDLPELEETNGLLLQPGVTFTHAASLSSEAHVQSPTSAASKKSTQSSTVHDAPTVITAAHMIASKSATATGETAVTESVEMPPGTKSSLVDINGLSFARVEWQIEDVRAKLQASMGRPLVSPPFTILGLPNLRLMVFPDARDLVKSAKSRERKGMYSAMVKKGPLYGALKLKAESLDHATIIQFHLTVGAVRRGPFTYDFSDSAIHGCDDFCADWLKQIDETNGCLQVGIEISLAEDSGPSPDQTVCGAEVQPQGLADPRVHGTPICHNFDSTGARSSTERAIAARHQLRGG